NALHIFSYSYPTRRSSDLIVIASTDATFNPFNTDYDLHIEGFECSTFTVPNGASTYLFVNGQTLDDYTYVFPGVETTINGATLTWYADASLTTTVPLTTVLSNNDVYYVTQSIDTCESAALMVSFSEFDCQNDLSGITSSQPGATCEKGTVSRSASAAS